MKRKKERKKGRVGLEERAREIFEASLGIKEGSERCNRATLSVILHRFSRGARSTLLADPKDESGAQIVEFQFLPRRAPGELVYPSEARLKRRDARTRDGTGRKTEEIILIKGRGKVSGRINL